MPLSGNNTPIYIKDVDNTPSVLLKCLSYEAMNIAMNIDEMVEKSGLSPQIIVQELLILELANRVTKVGGSGYLLTK